MDFKVDKEELMSELQANISRKISVDQRKVSLNALELFTRDKGIEKFITELVEDSA